MKRISAVLGVIVLSMLNNEVISLAVMTVVMAAGLIALFSLIGKKGGF